MPTSVLMPQMGESIAEGTIVRWIKKVGDSVDRDEPLFEISTDKVDAEIPSPAAGIVSAIAVKEGETVPVNSVVATIAEAGEAWGGAQAAATVEESVPQHAAAAVSGHAAGHAGPGTSGRPLADWAPANGEAASAGAASALDEVRRRKSSLLVRRMAADHGVDLSRIAGTGLGGRVTKRDVLEFIGQRESLGGEPPRAPTPHVPAYRPGDRVEIKPLSVMRKRIAEHMVLSRRTSAHVHSVFHVDFSHVEALRRQKKAAYEAAGSRLTYLAFIAKAVADALPGHPVINAALDGESVVYKHDVNLGIAVALESGLIVPVIEHADRMDLPTLSRAINDVAERARSKRLRPEEVHGGSFTITNPGQFGAQFGMPIINQPQVAILAVGTIERRPVVVGDAVAIRSMAYLTLGFDHRLVDGAVADQFMADVKQRLETFDPSQV